MDVYVKFRIKSQLEFVVQSTEYCQFQGHFFNIIIYILFFVYILTTQFMCKFKLGDEILCKCIGLIENNSFFTVPLFDHLFGPPL